MRTHVTGWIGTMGLIHGDMWHWLDRGNGIVSWGYATLAGAGQWGWFMAVCGTGGNGVMDWFRGACHGGTQHWLDQGDGIDLWGVPLGMQHGLDRGDGIDLWGYIMGAHDWIREMGLICGGMPLGCDTGWDMSWGRGTGSGDGIDLWGHAMGVPHWLDVGDEIDLSGRWNWFVEANDGGCHTTLARSGLRDWFMWARHESAQHWLDWGYGIDSWGSVERENTIWLLNLDDDAMCLMSGVGVSVQSVFG